jgi:uracil-DNA glycosylase family 4
MTYIEILYKEIGSCHDCVLAKTRTKVVPGEGPSKPEILLIGEAPGYYEDQQGRPFVGPAGQFLEQLLGSINLKRQQVYIANVIKCRPPSNRDPLPGEIKACSRWLEKQLELLQPKIIVTLGRFSMAKYFPNESISKIHGQAKKLENIICFPLYHPAAALHQGNLRKTIEADVLKIPQLLLELNKDNKVEIETKQLNLF